MAAAVQATNNDRVETQKGLNRSFDDSKAILGVRQFHHYKSPLLTVIITGSSSHAINVRTYLQASVEQASLVEDSQVVLEPEETLDTYVVREIIPKVAKDLAEE